MIFPNVQKSRFAFLVFFRFASQTIGGEFYSLDYEHDSSSKQYSDQILKEFTYLLTSAKKKESEKLFPNFDWNIASLENGSVFFYSMKDFQRL